MQRGWFLANRVCMENVLISMILRIRFHCTVCVLWCLPGVNSMFRAARNPGYFEAGIADCLLNSQLKNWICTAILVTAGVMSTLTCDLVSQRAHCPKAGSSRSDTHSTSRVHNYETVTELQQLHVCWISSSTAGYAQPS